MEQKHALFIHKHLRSVKQKNVQALITLCDTLKEKIIKSKEIKGLPAKGAVGRVTGSKDPKSFGNL